MTIMSVAAQKRLQSRADTAREELRAAIHDLAEAQRDRREQAEELARVEATAAELRRQADAFPALAERCQHAEDERAALEQRVATLEPELVDERARYAALLANRDALRDELATEQQAHNATATARYEAEDSLRQSRALLYDKVQEQLAAEAAWAKERSTLDAGDLRGRIARLRREGAADQAELVRLRAEVAALKGQSASERLLPDIAWAQGVRIRGLRQPRAKGEAQEPQRAEGTPAQRMVVSGGAGQTEQTGADEAQEQEA